MTLLDVMIFSNTFSMNFEINSYLMQYKIIFEVRQLLKHLLTFLNNLKCFPRV